MASEEETTNIERVVYATPLVYTSHVYLKRAEYFAIAIVFATLLWVTRNTIGLQIGMSVVIAVSLIAALHQNKAAIRRRIILRGDGLWIGGMDAGWAATYEQITLVEIRGLGSYPTLILRTEEQGAGLILHKADAVECFHALRELCPGAAAVDSGDRAYMAIDSTAGELSAEALLSLFLSRARQATIAGLFALLVWSGILALLIADWSTWAKRPATWIFLIALPCGIAYCISARFRFKQKARTAALAATTASRGRR